MRTVNMVRVRATNVLISMLLAAGTATCQYVPATSQERWDRYVRESFTTPSPYVRMLVPTVIEQWRNVPEEWGKGGHGFSRRLGARYAQVQLQNVMFHGSAAALGYRTQYESCGCEGKGKRIAHAISRIFITRARDGTQVGNTPLLASMYGAATIATNWYPERYSPWKEGLRGATIQLGTTAGMNVIREFVPELKRLFRR
jgi:hypothetical protein